MNLNRIQDRRGRNPCLLGFTLIELLVVIAIIGILAGLLFPSLSRAKQRTQGTYCMNNAHQLIVALHLYAADYNDWLPPNPDVGANRTNWVTGDMGNPREATNTLFLTDPKWAKLAPYTGPAPSLYKCPADKSTVTESDGRKYPRVRTFSMSQAVGTKPNLPLAAVDGPWLNGNHSHVSDHPYRTYGRLADMVVPAPSGLWVFLDEDEYSINDASFGVANILPTRWVDWPGTYHNFACGVAFGDGHAEIHKWVDGRTRVVQGDITPKSQPENKDILWLQVRTSANLNTGMAN